MKDYLKASAYKCKGLAYFATDNVVDAAETFGLAIATFETLQPSQYPTDIECEIYASVLGRSYSLAKSGNTRRAILEIDQAIEKHDFSSQPIVLELRADVVAFKVILLTEIGREIDEDTLAMFLELTACTGLQELITTALIGYVGQVGPRYALEKILKSEAKQSLLPLVTALQQEIGETPRVAKEVQEVADDIRNELAISRTSVEPRTNDPGLADGAGQ